MCIHFEGGFASLRQAEYALDERKVTGAPDRIGSLNFDVGCRSLRVPNLDGLVKGACHQLVAPVVCPIDTIYLGVVSTNALNR